MPVPIRNIFDLHCDTLSECYKHGVGLVSDRLHFSLDKLPEGYRLCQAMAVYIPDTYRGDKAETYFGHVYKVFRRQLDAYSDRVSKVTNTALVDDMLREKQVAMMLTVEGGSVLAGRLENLEKLHGYGVKVLTLTWNGENEISGGIATNVGFSPFGRHVVAEMERLGIIVDVSHLSDEGFYELSEFATRPFIASHSNARSICPHRRNLSDEMFCMIRDRGGLVGLNYGDRFVVEDSGSKTIDDLLRHVHHFLELDGACTLALGSDFDGVDIPTYLCGVDKLEYLCQSLIDSGIPNETVHNIMYENARRFFDTYAKERAI